ILYPFSAHHTSTLYFSFDSFSLTFRRPPSSTLSLHDALPITGERRLRVTYPDVTHYYSISNFQELLSFRANTNDKEVQNHLLQVKKHCQHLLRECCYGRDFADIKLNDFDNKISQNDFEKNPGSHCQYCHFFEMCMEREIDE